MFFHAYWCRKYAKTWSGGRFYKVLGDRKHFLLITHVVKRIMEFRFDDPPSICARDATLVARECRSWRLLTLIVVVEE